MKDRRRNILITKAHKADLTTGDQFGEMKVGDTSVRDFLLCCNKQMSVACSKSSLQSDVASTSRRSKLGAERLSIGHNRYLTKVTPTGTILLPDYCLEGFHRNRGSFGNPCIRVISKLVSVSIQITLKVKSGSSLSDNSPLMSLMSGSSSWMAISKEERVVTCNENNAFPSLHTLMNSNLKHIGLHKASVRRELAEEIYRLVSYEVYKPLDDVERESLIELISIVSEQVESFEEGIELTTIGKYPNMRALCYFNSCYFNPDGVTYVRSRCVPATLIERLFLGNTYTCQSISKH